MNIGVIYVAVRSSGGKYLGEAAESAKSLRRRHPNIPICVATDRPEMVGRPFDRTLQIETPRKRGEPGGKIDALRRSPFKRTLLLDTDTRICAPMMFMFDVLNHHDIAMALAPRRRDPQEPEEITKLVPIWFPERNTGVILVRRNRATDGLIQEWSRQYDRLRKWNDQIAMRLALWHAVQGGLRLYDLPPEYHCRILVNQLLGETVRIIHGRQPDMEKVCRQVNSHTGIRLYIPGDGIFRRKDWEKIK